MATANSVLISTHDLQAAGRLRDAFLSEEEGYDVRLVRDPQDVGRASRPRLLILTGGLEGSAANGFLEEAHRRELPVFALSPAPERSRGEARRLGIQEVFSSPPDPDDVVLLAGRIMRREDLRQVTGIVGESEAMVGVLDRIVQIAEVDSTVLITGESGTGKELVARGIHHLSPRRAQSFIPVNVAALTDTLLESELFGHEKGAFTGAIDTRKGFFELAHRGTVFLDEIGEMPHATQTKLLRVLEQKEFSRVGGEKPLRVDVRIIAATHQDLRQMVGVGDFRQDLYYRLNILHVELPPLRERPEDIPLLAHRFVEEVSERTGRSFPGISEEAMEILQAHEWPGNVRELRNLVESMVVLCPDREVRPGDIPHEIRQGGSSSLVPAPPVRRPRSGEEDEGERRGGESLRPELEFVFRTLVDLRVDLNDLREEFEDYRRRLHEIEEDRDQRAYVIGPGGGSERGERDTAPPREVPAAPPQPPRIGRPEGTGGPASPDTGLQGSGHREPPHPEVSGAPEGHETEAGEPAAGAVGTDEDAVVFRPGMTMEDLEREAIRMALEEVDGNRRKAAERLGIGERTLYRKIQRFGLDE